MSLLALYLPNFKRISHKEYFLKHFNIFIVGSIILLQSAAGANVEQCVLTDCLLGPWSPWEPCSETCGTEGIKSRNREIILEPSCGGTCDSPLVDTRPCNRQCCPRNCQFSEWTSWTDRCVFQESCNGMDGMREACYRFRDKTGKAECGGYCESKTIDVRCGKLSCYHDCEVSEWEAWSPCDAACEQDGARTRRRFIEHLESCGGAPCPDLEQKQRCRGGCCPQDCVLGAWGAWTRCDAACGEGVQSRRRVIQQGLCGGEQCPANATYRDLKPCTAFVNTDCVVSGLRSRACCVAQTNQRNFHVPHPTPSIEIVFSCATMASCAPIARSVTLVSFGYFSLTLGVSPT